MSFWPKTKPLGKLKAGIEWLLTRKGVCSSNLFDTVACVRSDKGVTYPDLQLCISPIAVDDQTWAPIQEHTFQIHVGLMRPQSRGHIELRDNNPNSPPRILANYLQDPRDSVMLRKGIRLIRELVKQAAFTELCGEGIFPGQTVQSDAQLDANLNSHVHT